MRCFIPLLLCFLLSGLSSPAPAQESSDAEPVRLANGVAMEGTIKKAAPESLTMETPNGVMTLPWKYLSAGTRYRHEIPMLKAIEKARIAEEAKKKAAAERAAKAAAAKAAAEAAKKAAGTNAAPAAAPASPKTTVPAVPSAAKPAGK